MKTWMSVLAVAVAGLMVAASAFAQGTATTPTPPSDKPASAEQPKDTTTPSAAEQPKDSATPSSAEQPKDSTTSAPAASPKTDEAKDAVKETKDAAKNSGRQAKDAMKGDMKAPRGNQEQVRAAQQALKDKGHDPGAIDGVMGPRTQAALKEFQKAQGLKDTGRLDAETMAKLGVEARTGARDTSTPAASPKTGPGASTSTPEMGKDAGSTKDAAKAPAGAPKRP